MTSAWMKQLLKSYEPGYGLPRDFYFDKNLYEQELACVWRAGWLFAAQSCEIPKTGDFKVVNLVGDELILVRDDEHQIRAFYNTCRHRGSALCDLSKGSTKALVCPYHQWTYDLCGRLTSARGLQEEANRVDLNLHQAHAEEVAGLIFVSLAKSPPEFLPAAKSIAEQLQPHKLVEAKVAIERVYHVQANWKLVLENNRECYHCDGNHPEYCAATYDVQRDWKRQGEELAAETHSLQEQWEALGLPSACVRTGSEMSGEWYRANRAPLKRGFLTQSINGELVAPPLNPELPRLPGTGRVTVFPGFWLHASVDHAVSTQLQPLGLNETKIVVRWLLRGDAVAEKDYSHDVVAQVWGQTSVQDWEICARQQRGIQSSQYTPGPLVQGLEDNVAQFHRWYLSRLAGN